MSNGYNFDKKMKIGVWEIGVDTSAQYGYFERETDGTGGGLWFVTNDDGKLELTDYDGVTCLSASIVLALRGNGFIVTEDFD